MLDCLRYALVSFLILINFIGNAAAYDKSRERDSLKILLQNSDSKTDKAQILLSLAESYAEESFDSVEWYLQRALKENSTIGSLKITGRIYMLKGDLYSSVGHAPKSLNAYRIALFCFYRTGDKTTQKQLLNTIGNIYSSAGNFSEALKYYLDCKELADIEGDIDMQGRLCNNMGKIYAETNDFPSAIEYYRKAIRIFTNRGDSIKLAAVQLNLASAYTETGKQELAGDLLLQAASVPGILDKKVLLGLSANIEAHKFFTRKKYNEALGYLFKSLNYVEEGGPNDNPVQHQILMTRILDNIGWAYYLSGNHSSANFYLLKGFRSAQSLNLLSEIVNLSDHLSMNYQKTGQLDSALFYLRINRTNADSLLRAQSINVVRLAEVKMDYEKEVKEKQTQLTYNKQLQRRNLVISLTIVLVLLALIIILMMRIKIINQKKQRVEAEKRHAELEQITTRELLEVQNKELVTKVMHSTKLNELVISIAEKLKKLELNEDSSNARIRNELIRELLSTANKDDSWKEFELRFQNVHFEFYNQLRIKFPSLTTSEVRLCALLKLDMSTKEISAITRQTERAIVVARHRLRQKLGLKNTDNLPLFLNQF